MHNVIDVKQKENKEIVGHIPEPLAEIIYPLLKSWKVYEITYIVTHRVIKKNSKAHGYFFYRPKMRKQRARDNTAQKMKFSI